MLNENWAAAVALAVGVGTVTLAGLAMPTAIKVGFELGTHGTYVVGEVPDCSNNTYCLTRTGTFVSDDGKVTLADVHVRNRLPKPLQRGDRVRAFDIGDPGEVYTNAGTQGWPVALPYIFGVAGLVALVFGLQHWALYLWRAVRRG